MPNCRNCGARITKFDKDMCPVCGFVNPLLNVSSDTIEITSQINMGDNSFNVKKKTKRTVCLMLSIFLGWTGMLFFYIKKYKLGLIWLIANIAIMSGLFILFYIAFNLSILLAILLPFVASYLVNIIIGVYYKLKPNLKDGNGELII